MRKYALLLQTRCREFRLVWEVFFFGRSLFGNIHISADLHADWVVQRFRLKTNITAVLSGLRQKQCGDDGPWMIDHAKIT